MLFHIIDNAVVVLRSRGVFRQVQVYRRNAQLYAKWSNGFIGLRAGNGTTLPHVSWDYIEGVQFVSPNIGMLQLHPNVGVLPPSKLQAIS